MAAGPLDLSPAIVALHDVVVFTDGTREELLRWNAYCRSRTVVAATVRGEDHVVPRPIKFIAAGAHGAACYLFTDFGPGFQCADRDGEPPVVRHVGYISNDKQGVVTLLATEDSSESHHGLPESVHDGYVTFSEVEGMRAVDDAVAREFGPSINGSGPWKVKHTTKEVLRKQRDGTYKVPVPSPHSNLSTPPPHTRTLVAVSCTLTAVRVMQRRDVAGICVPGCSWGVA